MILTLRIKRKNSFKILALLICLAAFLPVLSVSAQSALTLSVTPTLFDMSANPTQQWKSNVRVINPNPYEITVYADVVNFAPQGEAGQGKFVPVLEEDADGQTIAEWIDITTDPIIIPAEQTIEVPFEITVPEDPPPGGHFAALLIGTKPPKIEGQSQVVTSQIVTSLIFVRVTGDIIESGRIRSFRTLERIMNKPEAVFELRFENDGNVHILPSGEIRISNMWGQVRGIVPINQGTMFGKVLPDSIRKYSFTWTGEWSLADMGRYTAEATLAYGENGRKFDTSEITFWVIPWKMLTIFILVIVGFIALFTWGIKLYVRKMLSIAGVTPGYNDSPLSARNRRRVSVVAPIEEGMLDLRGQWQRTSSVGERVHTIANFLKTYKLFFIVLLLTAGFLWGVFWYIQSASLSERAYDVKIEGLSDDVHISSEEVKYQQQKIDSVSPDQSEANTGLPEITIVNRSGVSGLAADLRIKLEDDGYEILEIQNDLGVADENTVIVYNPEYTDAALELSQKVYGALTSAFVGESDSGTPITIYVGKDLENAVQ